MADCTIPRNEYPLPQWERKNWKNLNGKWGFDFDFGASARDRKLFEKDEALSKEILVPFCPESKLSGIEYKDFMAAVCYRKKFTVSDKELEGRVFLHFGAVDYHAFVYVNGKLAITHEGGYDSFKGDITEYLTSGENTVFVIAEDDVKSGKQPKGKQAHKFYSNGCDYTRTTGIWQTVWLEFTPINYIESVKYYTDINNGTITVIGKTCGKGTVEIKTSFDGKETGSASVESFGADFKETITLSEMHLWELGKGGLYDIDFTFGDDTVKSYFGMRSTAIVDNKFMLNNKSVFQRTVLDQGFYPDGIYTAPTEDDLVNDIKLSMAAGFNGARLHQKVFESRFLYHCDKMGYMVWGEHANWGLDYSSPQATEIFINEWMSIVERDFNHPAIIGWCPFNETWGYIEKDEDNRLLSTIYKYTKIVDVTRPCIDTSGNYHSEKTDIFDVHDYEQNPEIFKANYDKLVIKGELFDRLNNDKITQEYNGEAVFISEYGGIQWNTDGNAGWGYGNAPKDEKEFIERFKGLTEAILSNPKIMGLCYTQLYDIEQEINGLYTYDRKPKFDISIFHKVLTQKAAIED